MDADTRSVGLESLDVAQLTQAKKQADEELEHLTTSFTQLQAAQAKFRECLEVVRRRGASQQDNSILVPLTNSLYIRGHLPQSNHFVVDIGTGYFIEKNTTSATRFYESKVEELLGNIQDLETIIQQKSTQSQILEEGLRQKILSSTAGGSA